MAKFKSERYPFLTTYDADGKRVQFVDGEVEATGKAAEALRGLDESYGVSEAKGSDSGSGGSGKPTKAELKAEIDKRNEGRADDEKIVPASDKNDDLQAALDADDKAQAEK